MYENYLIYFFSTFVEIDNTHSVPTGWGTNLYIYFNHNCSPTRTCIIQNIFNILYIL